MSDYDDFYLVDDEGNAIPANAEASALVAAEYGDELQIHDTDEWYLEGMRECEGLRERLEALDFEVERNDDDNDGDGLCENKRGYEDGRVHTEALEDDDAWMTSHDAGYSREYSDGDEWILEELLARRPARRTTAATPSEQRIYDDDGHLVHTSTLYEYECRWRWYRETTWEIRTTIEDMGFVAQLDAFDAARALKARSTRLRPSTVVRKMQVGTLEQLLGGEVFSKKVFAKVLQSYMYISRYAAVNNITCETNFLKAWKDRSASHCPMILFHGTDPKNLNSIGSRGLLVPGDRTGVTVANGSACGVGIYAAKNASYSLSYNAGDNRMFVCVALVGPQYTTMKEVGDICVFFEADLIVPLWLIEFSTSPSDHQPAPTRVDFRTLVPLQDVGPVTLLEPTNPGHRTHHQNTGTTSTSEDVLGSLPPPALTKRMMKRMPRTIKSLYKDGVLKARRTS